MLGVAALGPTKVALEHAVVRRALRALLLRLGVGTPRESSGCRVQGAGCRVQGAGCRVLGAGCRVQGAGCRVQGAGCRVRDAMRARCPVPGARCVRGAMRARQLELPACTAMHLRASSADRSAVRRLRDRTSGRGSCPRGSRPRRLGLPIRPAAAQPPHWARSGAAACPEGAAQRSWEAGAAWRESQPPGGRGRSGQLWH